MPPKPKPPTVVKTAITSNPSGTLSTNGAPGATEEFVNVQVSNLKTGLDLSVNTIILNSKTVISSGITGFTGSNMYLSGDLASDSGVFRTSVSAPTFTGSNGKFTSSVYAPTFTGSVGRFTSSVYAPTFTGSDGIFNTSVSTPTFTGSTGIFSTSVSAPTITGTTGIFSNSISAPTFIGSNIYLSGNLTGSAGYFNNLVLNGTALPTSGPIATVSDVSSAISNLINGAPDTLDTLKELSEYVTSMSGSNNSSNLSIIQDLSSKANKTYVDSSLNSINVTIADLSRNIYLDSSNAKFTVQDLSKNIYLDSSNLKFIIKDLSGKLFPINNILKSGVSGQLVTFNGTNPTWTSGLTLPTSGTIATIADISSAIYNLINGGPNDAPGVLDTLKELADYISNMSISLDVSSKVNKSDLDISINTITLKSQTIISSGATGFTGSNMYLSGVLTGATGYFNRSVSAPTFTGSTGTFSNSVCAPMFTGFTGNFDTLIVKRIILKPQ